MDLISFLHGSSAAPTAKLKYAPTIGRTEIKRCCGNGSKWHVVRFMNEIILSLYQKCYKVIQSKFVVNRFMLFYESTGLCNAQQNIRNI